MLSLGSKIQFFQGGFDNLELAMAYYCQALKLSPSNMRALFGLFLVGMVLKELNYYV